MITRAEIMNLATDIMKQSGRKPTKIIIHPLDALSLNLAPGEKFIGMEIVKDKELPPNTMYLE